MADEGVVVGVEVEGEEAVGAECLPTAMVADGEWGGTATVVEYHGLGFGGEGVLDGGEELVGEETVFFEVGAIFEVDDLEVGGGWVFDGELVERDDGVLVLGEIIVGDSGGGGAHEGEGVC